MRYFILYVLLLAPIGCTANRESELLEARLREQENQLLQLSNQLDKSQVNLSVAQQESNALREQLTATGKQGIQPEQADVLYRMAKLKIDPYQSSILPAAHSSKPALINIVITPVDQFEEPLKLPGDVTITIFADSVDQSKSKPYHFTASDVRKKWNSGWVTSGFVIQLPLPEELAGLKNSGRSITLKATFKTTDGREFHATQKLRKKTLSDQDRIPIAGIAEEKHIKQAKFTSPEKTNKQPIDTSDRRTIDEFPIFR